MKILWFTNTPCGASEKLNPSLHIGGWLYSLEDQLVEDKNVDLSVAFYWNRDINPFKHKKTQYYPIIRRYSNIPIINFICRVINKRYVDKTDIKKLLNVIDLAKPDLIHIHGTELNFGLIQRHITIPVVISIQGLLIPYYEKYFTGIPLQYANRYEKKIKKITFRSEKILSRKMKSDADRERSILIQSRYIIGRTAWDKRVTRILAPSSIYFIGNEILRPGFYNNRWKKEEFGRPLHIVTIMSDGLYKGLETIAKTALIILQRNQLQFEWTVIGQSGNSNMAHIIRKWLNIDFNNVNINPVGKKNENEIIDTLLNADFYCQVSHIENSPNSVCEAMLLGMPIVATFAGGTESILENGREGILIQDGDPYSLAGAITEMANDFNKALFYSGNAFNRAQKRHNKDNIVKSLINTYSNCLTG